MKLLYFKFVFSFFYFIFVFIQNLQAIKYIYNGTLFSKSFATNG